MKIKALLCLALVLVSGVLLMAESVDHGWLPYAFSLAAAGVAVLGFFVHRLVGRH